MNTQKIAQFAQEYLANALLTDQLSRQLLESAKKMADNGADAGLRQLGIDMDSYFSGVKGQNLPQSLARFKPGLRSKKGRGRGGLCPFLQCRRDASGGQIHSPSIGPW